MSKTKSRNKAAAPTLLNDLPGMVDSAKAQAAEDTLTDLAEQGGKPGLPEPTVPADGKPGLPEPEAEPEYLAYSEEDADEDDQAQQEDMTFTEKDRHDLPILEQRAENGGRQQAEALRDIRHRQLWRLIRDDQGKQIYPSFEEYCQDRWGHPRQWVTHQTNWLRLEEERERLGIKERLTVKAAQGLLTGRLQEAGGLRAVLEEAKEEGVPLDRDHLREIVNRRAEFNHYSKDGTQGVTKPAAMTYAEYKKDLATVKELGVGQTSWDVVRRAKALDGDLTDNLVSLCQQERVLPRTDNLLAVLSGEALEAIVGTLKEVGKEAAEIEEKMKLLAARRKEIRAMQQEGGLRKLKEEEKALKQELEAKGVINSKKKAAPSQGTEDEAASTPTASGQTGEIVEKAEVSEVRDNLASALDCLNDALTCDWPEAEDAAELDAILVAAQNCETKLAEITAKAKELLADTVEPEEVPSGND